MLPFPFNQFRYILASKSPRRQQLFKGMGFEFDIEVREIEETVPSALTASEIAMYLSKEKSNAFDYQELNTGIIVITADTIVWHNNKMLGKPNDITEAFTMLQVLSDSPHEVFTGITLKSQHQIFTFCDSTKVYFRPLTDAQIEFYINEYQPFDKAGSYGVQEWIGYIGVESIEGSFYNVMGLPTQKLYPMLEEFLWNEIKLIKKD